MVKINNFSINQIVLLCFGLTDEVCKPQCKKVTMEKEVNLINRRNTGVNTDTCFPERTYSEQDDMIAAGPGQLGAASQLALACCLYCSWFT